MKIVQFIEFLRSRLKTVVRVCLVLLGLLVVASAIPGVVDTEHAHTWGEKHIPGFWAAFGFVGCVLIILLSKAFGHAGIMTREDYYDE